jgi:hypothetical protein
MKRNCKHCGTRMLLRQLRCRYCHESAVGWQHRVFIAACAAPIIFYLLK